MKIRSMLFFLIIISGLFSKMYALPSFSKEYKQNDSIADGKDKKKVNFQIRPSLGLTFSDSNADGERTTNLQWLGTLNSDFDYIGKKFDFSSTLFMQYGKSKITGQDAKKLQDAFILSITPSIPLIKIPVIRLFLETTAETNMGKGTIDDVPTSFLDPLFLYQTLFLGQKHYSYQNKDNTTWELTYGLGYAFQQTLNKKFEIQNDISGGKSDFESGFSGIIEFNVNSQISESLSFVLNAKAVALSRENFFQDFDASRRSILIRSGLFYKKVGMEYNYHQVHDLNLSENDMVDQSIMFTISF
ncbi:MAG TPA: hypothetical protein DCR40_08995 [Prolixibacteraceae bacterium]|nr:hypothetical protein [Prolixibacteraceae bacterium]